MSYIGNNTVNQNYVPAVDYFNGNGSTTAFTLSRPVASVAAVQAVISNVPQNPGSAFTVSGSTITFTSAPPSGTANIYVYYTSPNTQVVQPGQGTVGTVQLADASVTAAKLASTTGTGAVALASLPSFTTTIGVGGATASASGSGITFPATQSASSDANTLDDYEEGIWNPTLTYSTNISNTAPSTTKSLGSGRGAYIKIGKMVYFNVGVFYSDVGAEFIASHVSLPFQSDSIGIDGAVATNSYSMKSRYGGSIPTNLTQNMAINPNGTAVTLVWSAFGDGGSFSWFTSSTYIYITGCYRAAT